MTIRVDCPRVNVLGIGITATHLTEARDRILEAVRRGQHGYITVTNVHGVIEAQDDPVLRKVYNGAWMVTPDGMPMVWVGKMQGHRLISRVYGPDLMHEIFAASQDGSIRHFFYGGRDGVADELKMEMETRYPGVIICGTYTPPFRPLTDDEFGALADRVATAKPNLIWVGISTPKQDFFMAEMAGRLDCNLMLGVGAAFDFFTNRVSQAPRWIQRCGLEWLYRLVHEPRRLAGRYFRIVPRFVVKITAQFLGLIKPTLPP